MALENRIYRIELADTTGNQRFSGNTIAAGAGETGTATIQTGTGVVPVTAEYTPQTDADKASIRVSERLMMQYAITPLNSVTGGLASPAFTLGKIVTHGYSAATRATALTSLAMQVGQIVYQKVMDQLKKMQAKAEKSNNYDNALLRSGNVTEATYYTGKIWGVKKTTTRS